MSQSNDSTEVTSYQEYNEESGANDQNNDEKEVEDDPPASQSKPQKQSSKPDNASKKKKVSSKPKKKISKGTKPIRRSERAGITINIGRVERYIRSLYAGNVGSDVPTYISAFVEKAISSVIDNCIPYMEKGQLTAKETSGLSDEQKKEAVTKDGKTKMKRANPRLFLLASKKNKEINGVFDALHVSIVNAGVDPTATERMNEEISIKNKIDEILGKKRKKVVKEQRDEEDNPEEDPDHVLQKDDSDSESSSDEDKAPKKKQKKTPAPKSKSSPEKGSADKKHSKSSKSSKDQKKSKTEKTSKSKGKKTK